MVYDVVFCVYGGNGWPSVFFFFSFLDVYIFVKVTEKIYTRHVTCYNIIVNVEKGIFLILMKRSMHKSLYILTSAKVGIRSHAHVCIVALVLYRALRAFRGFWSPTVPTLHRPYISQRICPT